MTQLLPGGVEPDGPHNLLNAGRTGLVGGTSIAMRRDWRFTQVLHSGHVGALLHEFTRNERG